MIARAKKAYRVSYGFVSSRARIARSAAAPRYFAARALTLRWYAAAASRLRAARQRVAHELVLRALHAGDGSSDLDRRGAACRIAMWSFMAIAALIWLPLGWKLAILPLLGALTSGGVATVFWDAAGELEQREHPCWHR